MPHLPGHNKPFTSFLTQGMNNTNQNINNLNIPQNPNINIPMSQSFGQGAGLGRTQGLQSTQGLGAGIGGGSIMGGGMHSGGSGAGPGEGQGEGFGQYAPEQGQEGITPFKPGMDDPGWWWNAPDSNVTWDELQDFDNNEFDMIYNVLYEFLDIDTKQGEITFLDFISKNYKEEK